MKTVQQLTAMLAALVVLAALAFGAWFGFEYVVAAFAALDAQVARVTAIASVVALLSAWLVAGAVRQVGRDQLAVPLRQEKAATYRLFVDVWQQRLAGDSNDAIEDGLKSLDRLLSVFGSEPMVSAQLALRALHRGPAPAQADWVPLLGGALLQIRKELKADKVHASVLEGLIAEPEVVPAPSADTSALPGALSAV